LILNIIIVPMKKNIYQICLLGFCLISFLSCKKEKPEDTNPNPVSLSLEISSNNVFPYELFYLSSKTPLSAEPAYATFNGVETPAFKIDSFIYALALPDNGISSGKLEIKVGSGNQQFDMVVKSLPLGLTLDQVVSDHRLEMNSFENDLQSYLDTIKAKTGRAPDPALQIYKNRLDDSLNLYLVELNKLDVEMKKVVAAFFYANLQELQNIKTDLSQIVIGYSTDFAFKNGACAGLDNIGSRIDCYFNFGTVLVDKLRENLKKNMRAAAFAGVTSGGLTALVAKNKEAAWKAAEYTTIAVLGLLVSRDVMVYYENLQNTVLLKTFVAVEEELSERKSEIVFYEGKSTGLHYRVVRRNVNSADKKHNISSVTGFIDGFLAFVQTWMSYMPDWVAATPDFAPQLKIPERPENLKHLSIFDISNPDVQFVSLTGEPHKPDITFTSTKPGTKSFTFRIKYKDELFETVSAPISSILEPFNPCANSDLKALITKTASLLTASATGGNGPYTFTFRKHMGATASPQQGITNTQYIMTKEGIYDVIVTDANGCKDTSEKICVQEAVINKVECFIPTGKRACIRVEYSSINGLEPVFTQGFQGIIFYFTGTSDPYLDPAKGQFISKACDTGATYYTPYQYSVSETGDEYSKTLVIWFNKNSSDADGKLPVDYTYSIRFPMLCNGAWECPNNPGTWFSQEYQLSW
jgi:hypothetical protein